MIILTLDDFTGFQILARSIQNDPELQSYIDRYEKKYIHQLLGVTLGDLFIADLTMGVPSDPRFVAIFDTFSRQDDCRIYDSNGIKDILTALVFYHYIFDSQAKHSQSGVTLQIAETSKMASLENAARFGEKKWNEAIDSIEAIAWYCTTFIPADYPEYMGLLFRPKYSAIL